MTLVDGKADEKGVTLSRYYEEKIHRKINICLIFDNISVKHAKLKNPYLRNTKQAKLIPLSFLPLSANTVTHNATEYSFLRVNAVSRRQIPAFLFSPGLSQSQSSGVVVVVH